MRRGKALVYLLGAFLVATGCGPGSSLDLEDGPQQRQEGLTATFAAADGVLFQPDFVSGTIRQTNGGGFDVESSSTAAGTPRGGIAVDVDVTDPTKSRIWVADPGNHRALAFNLAAATGGTAQIVLGQLNLTDTNQRAIPAAEQITPTAVAVDSGGRVYLGEDRGNNPAKVLVYDNPPEDATFSSYTLLDTPNRLASIKKVMLGIDTGREHIAVVGESYIRFYRPGVPEPSGIYTFDQIPCGNRRITDLTQIGNILLLACGDLIHRCEEIDQGLDLDPNPPDYDPPGSFTCSAVFAYTIDTTAISPEIPSYYEYKLAVTTVFEHAAGHPAIPAYASPLPIAAIHGSDAENTVYIADTGNRVMRFSGAGAHLGIITTNQPVDLSAHPTGPLVPSALPLAAVVYGQPNTTNTSANWELGRPQGNNLHNPARLDVDNASDPSLWILDADNNRLLRFDDAGAGDNEAEVVLGQDSEIVGLANRLESTSCQAVSDIALEAGNRAYVVDRDSHRVMVYNGAFVVDGSFGQKFANEYWANSYSTEILSPLLHPSDLWSPSHIAVNPDPDDEADGAIMVNDAGNFRIHVYPPSPPPPAPPSTTPDHYIGAPGAFYPGWRCFRYGAMAARESVLYVATGSRLPGVPYPGPTAPPLMSPGGDECTNSNPEANRIFIYNIPHAHDVFDLDGSGNPDMVLGQDLVPNFWEVRNFPNRGEGDARPDSLWDVTGLASSVLPSGKTRLWVADRGNKRVVWYDDPFGSTDPLVSATVEAATADGVVGQPDLATNTKWYDPVGFAHGARPNAYNLNCPYDIAATADGGLWVSDDCDDRVLFFPTPEQPDEYGMPRASTVLGQEEFDDAGANVGWPSGRSLFDPGALAVDEETGRLLLVADRGNYRVLRFYRNEPPTLGHVEMVEVLAGETGTVEFSPADAEGDPLGPLTIVQTIPPDANVEVTGEAGIELRTEGDGATRDLVAGEIVRVEVSIKETAGPRPETATGWAVFHVIAAPEIDGTWRPCNPIGHDGAGSGAPPGNCSFPIDKEAKQPAENGCLCGSGPVTLFPGLVLVYFWRRRRR